MENNYNTQLSLKEFEAIVKHATSQPDQVIKTSNILKNTIILDEEHLDYDTLLDTYKTPKKWNSMSFPDKLKYNASKNLKIKAAFSDKFNAKKILKQMNIPNLTWARIITHVKAQGLPQDAPYYVPIEHEFYPKELKVDKLINFLKFYNIISNEEVGAVLKKADILVKSEHKYLTNSYIIKINIGWNSFINVISNKITKIQNKMKVYEPYSTNYITWKEAIFNKFDKNPYSKYRSPIIFAEEFIGNNLNVYEIYCIKGKPIILCHYTQHNQKKLENNYYIKEIMNNDTIIELPHRVKPNTEHNSVDANINVFKQIYTICLRLSRMFDFIRLDYYYIRNKIYFSEFSFTPLQHKLDKEKWGLLGKILTKEWTSS